MGFIRAGNFLRPFSISIALALGLSSMAAVTAIQASAALAASAGARPPKGLPGPVHPLPAPPGVRSPRSAGHPSSAVAGPQPAAPNVTGSAAMRADAQALAQARATGKPVAVPSLTSQTREVLAQPNGQFELVSNTMPVRVQAGGAWQPVSTTLRPGASGAWSAPLTAAPVTFSGGGSGPLVTVTDSLTGKSASVTFPFPLPRPVVTGSTALYKNVFPGTDLRLQATSTGYTEVLIVRNAAAASDLRLRSLTFTLRGGPGMSVRPGPHGSTAVVDAASGKQVFASGQPVMWDSVPAPSPAAAARAGAGGSGASMPVPVPVRRVLGVGGSPAQAALTLTPVTTSLAGRPVRYPLYIDPQVNETTAQYYSEVNDRGDVWNTTTGTTSQPSGVVQSGYCGYDQNAQFPCYWGQPPTLFFTSRVYFMVDTSVLAPLNGFRPNVYSASFAPHEVYNSASCASEPVAVWSTSTANISSSTSWPGPQGSQLGTASSNAGGGSGCSAAADVPVDITSVIQAHVQNADAPPAMAFEVRAPDESNKLQFKKFSKNPTFTVWFNYAPLQPTSLAASDAVTCTSTTYTSDNPPTLSARGVDNNPSPEDLYHTISLYDSAGNLVSTPNNGMAHNGGRHSGDPNSTNIRGQWTPGTLSNGATYHFTDQTQQLLPAGDQASARSSPVSAAYDFTVLSVPPASPPTISTVDYPVDPNGQAYWGQPQGAPAVFTVGTNGASHVAGFAYSFDGGTNSEPVPTTTDCSYLNNGGLGTAQGTGGFGITNGERALIRGSTAQIQVPASLPNGRHTLRVKSFDLAHNASAEATYTFYVTPNYQGQSTRMFTPDTPSTPTSLWSSRSGPNASLLAEQNLCCGMTTWPGGNQIRFDATTAGQSFSVSVNVPSNGTWQLGTDMTTAPDYGQVRLDLDGANLGGTAATPFDGYTASVSSVYLDLGTQTLTAGAHTLTVTVTGQNASSAGFKAGLIYLTLSPPNRYEADTLSYGSATAGTLQPQCFSQPTWADNCQLFLSNTAQGTSFQLNFAAPVESDYALGLNITTASDYGTLKFELDTGKDDYLLLDNTAAHPIDAYSSTVKAQYVFLGGIHLTSGTHSLKVTVVGTNASSTGNRYNAGINYLAAAPVTGAKMDSFTHAMNNLGIASDFGSGSGLVMNFDLVNSATGNNLSLQALQDAGITVGTATSTGNTFSLGGATFTMPQLRTDSAGGPVVDDNVVPDGQTIAVTPARQGHRGRAAGDIHLRAFPRGERHAELRRRPVREPGHPVRPRVGDWRDERRHHATGPP